MSVSARDLGEVQVEHPSRGLPYALADHKGHDARFESAYEDGTGVIVYCVDCGENVAWTAYVPPEPTTQATDAGYLTTAVALLACIALSLLFLALLGAGRSAMCATHHGQERPSHSEPETSP